MKVTASSWPVVASWLVKPVDAEGVVDPLKGAIWVIAPAADGRARVGTGRAEVVRVAAVGHRGRVGARHHVGDGARGRPTGQARGG